MITASTAGLGDYVPNYLEPTGYLFWVAQIFFSLSLAGALINQIPAMSAHAAHTTLMAEQKMARAVKSSARHLVEQRVYKKVKVIVKISDNAAVD